MISLNYGVALFYSSVIWSHVLQRQNKYCSTNKLTQHLPWRITKIDVKGLTILLLIVYICISIYFYTHHAISNFFYWFCISKTNCWSNASSRNNVENVFVLHYKKRWHWSHFWDAIIFFVYLFFQFCNRYLCIGL